MSGEMEKGCVNMDLLFPILFGPSRDEKKVYVPWDFVAPHEAQAQRNHGQALKRLKERGGLSPTELLAVLKGESWSHKQIHPAAAWMEIFGLYRVFVQRQAQAQNTRAGLSEVTEALREIDAVTRQNKKPGVIIDKVREEVRKALAAIEGRDAQEQGIEK